MHALGGKLISQIEYLIYECWTSLHDAQAAKLCSPVKHYVKIGTHLSKDRGSVALIAIADHTTFHMNVNPKFHI